MARRRQPSRESKNGLPEFKGKMGSDGTLPDKRGTLKKRSSGMQNSIPGRKDDRTNAPSEQSVKRNLSRKEQLKERVLKAANEKTVQKRSFQKRSLPEINGNEADQQAQVKPKNKSVVKGRQGKTLPQARDGEKKMDERQCSTGKKRRTSGKKTADVRKCEAKQQKGFDEAPKAGCSKSIDLDLGSSSGSEDEWVDVEGGDNDVFDGASRDIEVTIKEGPKVESEESKWAKFLRLEVNRKIRERQVNCHKMHLLCYMAHLRFWVRALVRSEFLKTLCFSLIPDGYSTAAAHSFDTALAERFLKWLTSAFVRSSASYVASNGFCPAQVERLERLINDKTYETVKDLASITFLCLLALEQPVRLVMSCQPMPLKVGLDKLIAPSKEEEEFEPVKKERRSNTGSKRKSGEDDNEEYSKTKKKRTSKNGIKEGEKTRTSNVQASERDYWVEYWDDNAERWICVDPWMKTVDLPESIEGNVTAPMHYVIAVDNAFGIRDVTARYASRYLYHDVRRLRVDSEWWDTSLKVYRSKNRTRERLEDVQLHDYLMSLQMPTNIADFKNHPLYVLKKDLLKYEAIYPLDQKPVGQIRGIDIFPRSCVYHLDGSLNWIKKARSIKAGEKPYKVVKARPDVRVPKEERQDTKTLDLYGFWQTEPYQVPKVINGRIPRNEHGNLYLYKKSMLPEGCAYVRLDGLYGIARRLNLECVPCVVGWEFHKNGNHPIIDGCAVLKEDEARIREEWSKHYEKKCLKAAQRCRERARKNWRRLYRGVILTKRIRARFSNDEKHQMNVDEQLETLNRNEDTGELATDDASYAWPRADFDLPLAQNPDQA